MRRMLPLAVAFLAGLLIATAGLWLTFRPHVVDDGRRCNDQLISAMLAHGGERWDTEAAHLREMGAACNPRFERVSDYVGLVD
jgi:hypothetical protein